MKNVRFWGIIVKPGETVKCDPGDSYCHISQIGLQQIGLQAKDLKVKEDVGVFLNVDDISFNLCTLSVENHPQVQTDLVFNKEFGLRHSSNISNISILGYQFDAVERYNSATKEGDESDEEIPLAIPLDYNVDDDKSKDGTHIANELSAPKPAGAPSSKSKATIEDTNSPGKPKANDKLDGGSTNSSSNSIIPRSDLGKKNLQDMVDGQDRCDDNDSESSDQDVNCTPQKAKNKSRPVETSLMTPLGKNTEIATPSIGKQTGSAAGKRSGYVHVATPHPGKRAKKTPANSDKSKQSTGHVHVATPHPAKQAKTLASIDKSKQSTGNVCKSCNRTFNSSMGLEAHSRAKHGTA